VSEKVFLPPFESSLDELYTLNARLLKGISAAFPEPVSKRPKFNCNPRFATVAIYTIFFHDYTFFYICIVLY